MIEPKSTENFVDNEIDEISKFRNIFDRAELLREVVWDILNEPEYQFRAEEKGELKYLRTDHLEGVKSFQLPYFQGEDPKPSLERFFASDKHLVARVPQGALIEIERGRNPIFFSSMTECSFLLGRGENSFTAAHIGFSERLHFDSAFDYFKKQGIEQKDMYVVASTGDVQLEHRGGVGARLGVKKDYQEYGIPSPNILDFDYRKGRIIQTVTNGNLLFAYCYDYDLKGSPYRRLDHRSDRIGEYVDQRVVEIK